MDRCDDDNGTIRLEDGVKSGPPGVSGRVANNAPLRIAERASPLPLSEVIVTFSVVKQAPQSARHVTIFVLRARRLRHLLAH